MDDLGNNKLRSLTPDTELPEGITQFEVVPPLSPPRSATLAPPFLRNLIKVNSADEVIKNDLPSEV
jgi:hypothetical protein